MYLLRACFKHLVVKFLPACALPVCACLCRWHGRQVQRTGRQARTQANMAKEFLYV